MASCLRYPGKVVIVTGGTKGIGLGIVREFVRQGAKVVFCSVPSEEEDGQGIQRDLKASGCSGDAYFQVCDVRKESDIKRLIRVTVDHYGCLDCLVNNAGSGFAEPIDIMSAQDFRDIMELNTVSCFLASKYALPHLRKTKGNIINIGSLSGLIGIKNGLSDAASKGAVISMTRSLAIDESKHGHHTIFYLDSIGENVCNRVTESKEDNAENRRLSCVDLEQRLLWVALVDNLYRETDRWNGTLLVLLVHSGASSAISHMKMLEKVIGMFELWCDQYVEDTQLYHTLPPHSEDAVDVLNWCLESVTGWMRVNKLKLNPDKTDFLRVSRKVDQGLRMSPVSEGVILPFKRQVHSLGVLLDIAVTFENSVAVVVQSTSFGWCISCIHSWFNQSIAMVMHVFVKCRLDYCIVLCLGLPMKSVQKLQLKQRQTAGMDSLLRYPGKVVIVTGGTSGIGLATVREFVRQGAKVVFCSKAPEAEKGRAIQRDLQAPGCPGDAYFQVCDVRSESDIKRLIQVTLERYGCLDCLVNNAGTIYLESSDDVTAHDFENLMQLNAVSCLLLSKYALPYLRQTKGNIVNVGSIEGTIGMKYAVSAVASKGAVIAMTKALAIDESKYGVRVNSISPSNIWTPLWESEANRFKNLEAVLQEGESYQLLGRFGTPEEVALGILFLAADGTFCTGLDLLLTGGAEVGFGRKSPMGPDSFAIDIGNLKDSSSN
ncbi:PREDICTED: uncharacterized protein LOC107116590 [Gekko japonicus]|uniref:Uncharacterized protein LOC107116590 n=1 Tax=Gekko japonicus TaxID=146911 RepID=A0ABM1KJX7_GEKJA|nr:PREDICTED: uncharacterized protein LOC107116590 [Gekko japonicus]